MRRQLGTRVAQPARVVRRPPAAALDVTRIEHENLYAQVLRHSAVIHRLEKEIRLLKARMEALEEALQRPRRSTG